MINVGYNPMTKFITIAKTATAINNIVPTPFLILLSFFLSVPVSPK